jgi:hypothetical protein
MANMTASLVTRAALPILMLLILSGGNACFPSGVDTRKSPSSLMMARFGTLAFVYLDLK